MSVAEILHQIEALPSEERQQLVNKLVQQATAEAPDEEMTEAERRALEQKLMQRPDLGAELAGKLDRMLAGHAADFEDIKALHQQLAKLGL